MTIGASQIRAARAILEWSQEDLATAAGLAVSTIRGLETGHISPRNATASTIRQALEKTGLEFIEMGGVKLSNKSIRYIEGPDSRDVFFDDMLKTVREEGGEIVCGFRSPELMTLMFSQKRGDFKRMSKLCEIVPVRCLIVGLPEGMPPVLPCRFRIASKMNIGYVSFLAYGNKHTVIMAHSPADFSFTVFNAAGWAQDIREHFAEVWETAIPVHLGNSFARNHDLVAESCGGV